MGEARRIFHGLLTVSAVFSLSFPTLADDGAPGNTSLLGELADYVATFQRLDPVEDAHSISNDQALAFLTENIPLIDIPDEDMEEIYYFRWWGYRKHLKQTSGGWVVTEFLYIPGYADGYGVINAPAGHHIYEGRWLRHPSYMQDYLRYFLTDESASPRNYSFWLADSLKALSLVHPDDEFDAQMLPMVIDNYQGWVRQRRDKDRALFWQADMKDAMEWTVGGRALHPDEGFTFRTQMIRPSFNAYMYADAKAIAGIARREGNTDLAARYDADAETIKAATQSRLWNDTLGFFTIMARDYDNDTRPVDVREQIGFVPWAFGLPDDKQEYGAAWQQLTDPEGFQAPYGPTTVEQRHPWFTVDYVGALEPLCQWNGPSWPYATAQTLTALIVLLNDYSQHNMTSTDFNDLLSTYTRSHRFRQIGPDDRSLLDDFDRRPPVESDLKRPWIGENLDPYNGTWLTRYRRYILDEKPLNRAKNYNHSSYADIILSGLFGVRPEKGVLSINPLAPSDWDWYRLERVSYQGRELEIVWDRTGDRYGIGAGYSIFLDTKRVHHAAEPGPFRMSLQ